jgi:hypothetical protein
MRTSKCFAMDSSEMENKPFVGFTSININDGHSWKFRIAKMASTFMAEAPAIGKTLEIIEKIDSEQSSMIFSDLASVLQGISNASTMNNTLHITQMLKDRIEWNCEGRKIQFYWILGHCGIEVNELMRGPTLRQSNQSKKAQTVNYYYQWQKKMQREASQFLSKHQTGQRKKLL